LPVDLKNQCDDVKKEARYPWWSYNGVFFYGIGAIVLFMALRKDVQLTQQYLENPQKGDVWMIKLANNNYTLQKVFYVESDFIFTHSFKLPPTSVSKIETMNSGVSEVFNNDTLAYSNAKIEQMYHDKRIYKVIRKKD
jgi:hypothetical protein